MKWPGGVGLNAFPVLLCDDGRHLGVDFLILYTDSEDFVILRF